MDLLRKNNINQLSIFGKAYILDVFHFTKYTSEKNKKYVFKTMCRGGSRTAATFKLERFVIIVNGFQPLSIITKNFILDVVAVLDPSLMCALWLMHFSCQNFISIEI